MANNKNTKVPNVPNSTDKGNTIRNVPHLRFPEFTEEWERKRFKDVCNITTGNKNTQDKSDNGIYPFYVRSKIVERINSWTFDGEAILTAGDGVGVGKVFHYSTGKIGVHQRVYILSDFKCDGKYLYSYFAGNFYNRVKRMSAKNSVDSVRMEMIADMPISLPSNEEQKKIGHLLALLDERIATQNKIIEDLKKLKSAIIEKLFCSPKDKQPEVRLHGFSDNWQIIRLSDICHRILRKNTEEQCRRVLTIAAQHGLISQEEFFNKNVASENLSGYYLLQNGDFAYNKSYSGDYVWGTVKRLDNYEQGVLSPLYICFRPDSAKVDSDFLIYYFESKKWHKAVADIAGEGARNHGLLNISVRDYFNTIHCIPSMDEQKQIAQFVNTLSSRILREQRMVNCYAAQRQYLLRQMFI